MTIEIGILFSAISVTLAVLGYQLSKTSQQMKLQQHERKGLKADTETNTEEKAAQGYIRKGVGEIRIAQKDRERHLVASGERLTRVEGSTKQAHKRLDNVVSPQ